jgi:hypothetical protein
MATFGQRSGIVQGHFNAVWRIPFFLNVSGVMDKRTRLKDCDVGWLCCLGDTNERAGESENSCPLGERLRALSTAAPTSDLRPWVAAEEMPAKPRGHLCL